MNVPFQEKTEVLSGQKTDETTLASDSSPFHEKYEVDEDRDILGEVRFDL